MYVGEKFKQSFGSVNVVLWDPETLYFGMLVLKGCEFEREHKLSDVMNMSGLNIKKSEAGIHL